AGKESASFAFPFNVPGADLRVDLPLACMRPATDQLPASCASWITPGRWMDVANADFGVAWVTLDAPLVLLTDPVEAMRRWRPQVPSANRQSQFYSWIMNNRWGTNYRAYQEGPVTFRYAVQPHGRANAADLTRLATGLSQPLLALAGKTNQFEPAVRLHHPDVIISSLKPADHGRGIIVRLFGVGGRDAEVDLLLPQPGGLTLFYSDTSEAPLKPVTGPVPVPGFGLVTLRADFK
ncbi:MAG TPA: hypothetical protein VN673_15240, partial [Clostridia bacterium]|nr:hypothetical protein [Clostridia bacterium]